MLGPGILDLVRATYFKDASRRTEAYASPLRADNLADLPPTDVVTAEHDLLQREGARFVERLTEARVPVQHRMVPGHDHYFLDRLNARTEMGLMAAALRRHLVDVRE